MSPANLCPASEKSSLECMLSEWLGLSPCLSLSSSRWDGFLTGMFQVFHRMSGVLAWGSHWTHNVSGWNPPMWIYGNSSTFKISCHFLESTESRKPRISKSQDEFIFLYSFYSSEAKTEFFTSPNKAACLFMLWALLPSGLKDRTELRRWWEEVMTLLMHWQSGLYIIFFDLMERCTWQNDGGILW